MSSAATTTSSPLRARKTWRTLEPVHAMIYFVPEATEVYARLGVTGPAGYFASRSAPMGAVSPEVVVSTFFNFNPELVHAAIPHAWEVAAPKDFVAARFEAVDAAFQRVLGDSAVKSESMRQAAGLARVVAEAAASSVEGRPLAAGHADVAWPEAPHLVLWHAQSILREYRGDGHIAQLMTHGLTGLDALVTHAASGDVRADVLRATRAWSPEAWDSAVESLRGGGWLEGKDALQLTEWGSQRRQAIEDGTDELASAPYDALGEEGCTELRALVRPWSRSFAAVLG